MKLGFITDAMAHMSLDDVCEFAADIGVDGIELATGNWSNAPHLEARLLDGDRQAKKRLLASLGSRDLRLLALNANGNQLHPVTGPRHDEVVRATIKLAGELGVETVVLMSGLPAAPGDRYPNWITSSWPPEAVEILRHQWDIALPYWNTLTSLARACGVTLAVEMHGRQLVFNPESFTHLRDEVGDDVVKANLDPSHLMWQSCDILEVIHALGGSIGHVHAKDVRIEPTRARVQGLLDPRPPSQAGARAWNYVTLGHGHPGGAVFWSDFLYALRSVGYDGAVSVEHEDVLVSGAEGVRTGVAILRRALFREAPDWTPADV